MNRWFLYQRERFPLVAHAPLVAAFSLSALCFSRLLRGETSLPRAPAILVAFITALLFFLQLRITDEFKDFEDDARFRPYRPVPRGLVTLRELGWIAVAAAAVQLALALWFEPSLAGFLVLAWGYLALMTCEFFAPAWLKARPVAYMASHMVIIPLIDLYATACDWRVAGARWPPGGLAWFLLVSYFNGLVIEIGRKTRAPEDEEMGVETYSALWGRSRAVTVWLLAVVTTALVAWLAARAIAFQTPVALLLLVLIVVCALAAGWFLRRPVKGGGKLIETVSGIWTLLMYLALGAIPAIITAGRTP